MASPKKPKKAFIQFAVAAVVALVVGGIGVVLLFLLFTGVTANNEMAQQQHQIELKKKEKKLAALEEQMTKLQANKRGPKADARKYTEVQIAVKIPLGTPIEESMLKEIELKAGQRPAMNSFPRISSVVGKVSAIALLPGETVTASKLLDTEGMVAVSEGKRAISIKVDNIGSVGGAVVSGTYVDVMATFAKSQLTKTLLQNVRVISAGDPPAPPSSPNGKKASLPAQRAKAKDAVTLEVSPAEAEIMALANKEAFFHLALRGFGDTAEETLYGADIGQLITGISPAETEQASPPAHQVPNRPNEIPVSYSDNPNQLPEPAVPDPENQTFQMEIYKGANSESKDFQWQY